MRLAITDTLESLGSASFIAVAAEQRLDTSELSRIAKSIAKSRARVVAVWGPQSEVLHDMVDREAIALRAQGPTTVWERDTLNDFIWNVAFTYQGLDNSPDEEQMLGVLYFGNPALRDNIEAILSEWDLRSSEV